MLFCLNCAFSSACSIVHLWYEFQQFPPDNNLKKVLFSYFFSWCTFLTSKIYKMPAIQSHSMETMFNIILPILWIYPIYGVYGLFLLGFHWYCFLCFTDHPMVDLVDEFFCNLKQECYMHIGKCISRKPTKKVEQNFFSLKLQIHL